MAKLSARGHYPLREFTVYLPEGYELGGIAGVLDEALETFYVLRSDGVVLTSHRSPDRPNAYQRKRSGYTVKGKLRLKGDELKSTDHEGFSSMLEAFETLRRQTAARVGEGAVVSEITVK